MSISGKIAMAILRASSRLTRKVGSSAIDIEKELKKSKIINEKNTFVFPKDKKALYNEVLVEGYHCLVIRSRKSEPQKEQAILFIYGGTTNRWKAEISIARGYADRTGMDIWYPIYPSISEVNITKTIDVLYAVYRKMLKKYTANNVAIVGDSFGGLFATEIINWNNRSDTPVPMPRLIIANSPGGIPDTPEDWAEMEKYAKTDYLLNVEDFRMIDKLTAHGQDTPKHAYCPLYEDFHNAPETYMYFGEECCAGNARAYREAFERAGCENKLHIHIEPGMMHGYSSIPVFPESKRSYYEIIRLLNNES